MPYTYEITWKAVDTDNTVISYASVHPFHFWETAITDPVAYSLDFYVTATIALPDNFIDAATKNSNECYDLSFEIIAKDGDGVYATKTSTLGFEYCDCEDSSLLFASPDAVKDSSSSPPTTGSGNPYFDIALSASDKSVERVFTVTHASTMTMCGTLEMFIGTIADFSTDFDSSNSNLEIKYDPSNFDLTSAIKTTTTNVVVSLKWSGVDFTKSYNFDIKIHNC